MDFNVSKTFQPGERIRIMEALTACLTLAEAKFNHFSFEGNQFDMELCCYCPDLETLKRVDKKLRMYLDPRWERSQDGYETNGREFWTLVYKYRFA